MQITDRIKVYHLKFFTIMLIKNEMPAAREAQSSGANTSKMGSLVEVQLNALNAPTGMSQSRAKLAKSISTEKRLKSKMIK